MIFYPLFHRIPPAVNTPYDMPVGEAVFYGREQTVGLVYETYTFVAGPHARPGVSILLSDGRDVGGFSAEEADQWLVPLGATGLDYEFACVGRLHQDYAAGRFGEALHYAQVQYLARTMAGPQFPQDALPE